MNLFLFIALLILAAPVSAQVPTRNVTVNATNGVLVAPLNFFTANGITPGGTGGTAATVFTNLSSGSTAYLTVTNIGSGTYGILSITSSNLFAMKDFLRTNGVLDGTLNGTSNFIGAGTGVSVAKTGAYYYISAQASFANVTNGSPSYFGTSLLNAGSNLLLEISPTHLTNIGVWLIGQGFGGTGAVNVSVFTNLSSGSTNFLTVTPTSGGIKATVSITPSNLTNIAEYLGSNGVLSSLPVTVLTNNGPNTAIGTQTFSAIRLPSGVSTNWTSGSGSIFNAATNSVEVVGVGGNWLVTIQGGYLLRTTNGVAIGTVSNVVNNGLLNLTAHATTNLSSVGYSIGVVTTNIGAIFFSDGSVMSNAASGGGSASFTNLFTDTPSYFSVTNSNGGTNATIGVSGLNLTNMASFFASNSLLVSPAFGATNYLSLSTWNDWQATNTLITFGFASTNYLGLSTWNSFLSTNVFAQWPDISAAFSVTTNWVNAHFADVDYPNVFSVTQSITSLMMSNSVSGGGYIVSTNWLDTVPTPVRLDATSTGQTTWTNQPDYGDTEKLLAAIGNKIIVRDADIYTITGANSTDHTFTTAEAAIDNYAAWEPVKYMGVTTNWFSVSTNYAAIVMNGQAQTNAFLNSASQLNGIYGYTPADSAALEGFSNLVLATGYLTAGSNWLWDAPGSAATVQSNVNAIWTCASNNFMAGSLSLNGGTNKYGAQFSIGEDATANCRMTIQERAAFLYNTSAGMFDIVAGSGKGFAVFVNAGSLNITNGLPVFYANTNGQVWFGANAASPVNAFVAPAQVTVTGALQVGSLSISNAGSTVITYPITNTTVTGLGVNNGVLTGVVSGVSYASVTNVLGGRPVEVLMGYTNTAGGETAINIGPIGFYGSNTYLWVASIAMLAQTNYNNDTLNIKVNGLVASAANYSTTYLKIQQNGVVQGADTTIVLSGLVGNRYWPSYRRGKARFSNYWQQPGYIGNSNICAEVNTDWTIYSVNGPAPVLLMEAGFVIATNSVPITNLTVYVASGAALTNNCTIAWGIGYLNQ